nr:MAG TPA: hypothetical protein [Caudoviricetes sp.]
MRHLKPEAIQFIRDCCYPDPKRAAEIIEKTELILNSEQSYASFEIHSESLVNQANRTLAACWTSINLYPESLEDDEATGQGE